MPSVVCSMCVDEGIIAPATVTTVPAPPRAPGLSRQQTQGLVDAEMVHVLVDLCRHGSVPDGGAALRQIQADELKRWTYGCAARAAHRAGAHLVMCPSPACGVHMWLDEAPAAPSATGRARSGVRARCMNPACRTSICMLCGSAWTDAHRGKACGLYLEELARARDEASVRTALGDSFKNCPNPACRMPLTHPFQHACHHIRPSQHPGDRGGCPSCGVHFCYVCLALYQDSRRQCTCPLFCPRDRSCGCPLCFDCQPGRSCPQCPGCVVCRADVPPPVRPGDAAAASGRSSS